MATDGTLIFDTGIDNSGFEDGLNNLKQIGNTALGMLAADIAKQIGNIAAQIPAQMLNVGSGFEAAMSQVAATMGMTAESAEFEILSAAASEMGETTKFSASQAAEALNYLALAGYDTEKAVGALPTVLNVAAAGGMELASASDMITDAMSALGLETSQMSTFADQLAVTAQKSNTSVSQLGEAILTVGGTAKSLSGGVVEMNTALGILADNGIKGSEGGTALRNVILSLSAPTDTAAAALSSLGVTAFDASGSMRPLQDTFADLETALSQLSEQERTAVLNEIFNKVDLKSVNALLGTSAERFDELSGYISSCSGAAAQMAETMDDNLKGDLTIMQSALEGLGIAAYEKFQVPMRTAVQEVTASIGGLTSSLNDGELSESMDKVAEGFGNIVSSATQLLANEVLPELVNTLAWVVDNGQSIATVAGMAAAAIVTYKVATEGATIAQIALNSAMNVNPLLLIASAAAAATVAIVSYTNAANKKMELANNVNEATQAIYDQTAAFNKLLEKADENIQKAEENAEVTKSYWQEVKNLADENGKAKTSASELETAVDRLNEVAGTNIQVIYGQIQGYRELSEAMDENIEKSRIAAQRSYLQESYGEALVNIGDVKSQYDEITKLQENAVAEWYRLKEEYAEKEAEYNDILNRGGYAGDVYQGLEDRKKAIEELGDDISNYGLQLAALSEQETKYQDTIKKYEGLKIEEARYNPDSKKTGQQLAGEEYAEKNKKHMEQQAEDIILTQEEMNEKLKSGWENLNHAYAMGVIASEEELYTRKSALLRQYGNENLSEHWTYYEELYDQQQEFAEKSKRASEDAAKEAADIREQEWENISRLSTVGLITAEDAYRRQLEWIQKYCPEYADEWYSYYKTVIDYQREAMSEQVEGVKSSISETLNEYKKAYSELENSVNSYKNRLLSVGSTFSIEESDGNKYYNVENLSKQKAAMQKYHDYVKQLKERGMSQDILSEMTSYDFDDGMFFAENLAKMSDAELKQINELYSEKKKLAEELSNELYAPEMEKLNTDLVNGVISEFGTLPDDIKEIGSAALEAFIEGISETENLSEKVSDFTDNFFTACNEGIENGIAGLNLIDSVSAAFEEQNTYAIGKEKGDELVSGFNDALNGLYSQFENEKMLVELQASANFQQAEMANAHSRQYQYQMPNSYSESNRRVVLENHVNTTVQLDRNVVGKAAYEYIKEYQHMTST